LAEANENCNWKMYIGYAPVLIKQAHPLFADDTNFRQDIYNMVNVLDRITIYLCLSLFPRTKYRKAKGAVKTHSLIGLLGFIYVIVEITNDCTHDINIMDSAK